MLLAIEIILISFCIIVVGGVLSRYIYKRMHNLPTGCDGCKCMSKEKMLKEFNKKYKKDKTNLEK